MILRSKDEYRYSLVRVKHVPLTDILILYFKVVQYFIDFIGLYVFHRFLSSYLSKRYFHAIHP